LFFNLYAVIAFYYFSFHCFLRRDSGGIQYPEYLNCMVGEQKIC
jgi:hypothetical protein